MKCAFCGKEIPKERVDRKKKKGGRLKYCSKICNKNSWRFKNSNVKNSTVRDGAGFGSTTQKGLFWENYIAKKLDGAICVSNERMNQVSDVIWNGMKIDVKSCNLFKRKIHHGKPAKNLFGWWVFNRNSFKKEIDYFACVCVIKNKVEKIYLIPTSEFPKSGITIGQKSKYDKFLTKI